MQGYLVIITIIVAWCGGAFSIWLTREDARLTKAVKEIGYLHACIDDLADVTEKLTAAIEQRWPRSDRFVPETDAESVSSARASAQNEEKEED